MVFISASKALLRHCIAHSRSTICCCSDSRCLLVFNCFKRLRRLLTGLVLALLSGTRQIYLARQEEQLNWLEGLLSTLQKYTRIHQNLARNKGKDEDRFNCAYDILCIGNEAIEYLRWNPDNKTLGFDPYVYCKQNYGIDLNVMKEHSQNLHERLMDEDFPVDNHSVWEWFREFDHDLHQLCNAVEKDIQNHKILLATAKRTII